MNTTLRIFKRDLNRIFRNFVALLVVGGVCLIPAAYAWFNIYANMDPYSNTAGIKVAICSKDRGTSQELTGDINVGDQILDNIRENDALGWTFVDEEQAVEGVRSGEYYAALVIPENFSQDMVSFLNGDLEEPMIDYYLNEKRNTIAPKVTDTGATTIQTTINETFVSVASKSVAELLDKSTGQVSDKVTDLQDSLNGTLNQVADLMDQYQNSLASFQETYASHQDLMDTAEKTLEDLEGAADSGIASLNASAEKIENVRDASTALSQAAQEKLQAGSSLLTGISQDTADGMAKVNVPVQTASGKLTDLMDATQSVLTTNQEILGDLEQLNSDISQMSQNPDLSDTAKQVAASLSEQTAQQIGDLQAVNARHQAVLTALQTGNSSISDASSTLTNLSDDWNTFLQNESPVIQSAGSGLQNSSLTAVSNALDRYAYVSGALTGILGNVKPTVEQIRTLSDNLNQCLAETGTALTGTQTALQNVSDNLRDISADVDLLTSSEAYLQFKNLSGLNSDQIATFMKSPVTLETEIIYPVENYGSAMSPFYTNLAIWVSGIILVSIFKTEVDADDKIRKFTSVQAYVGRGLLFISVGLIQALIITLGDIYLLKVQCINPVGFVFAGLVTSFVYVNLIYGLASAFKHIGKALCVVLVILQIPGGAGTYPIELTPSFFQKLHPFLPFTYSINAMRETVAGAYGHAYSRNLLCLLAFLPIAWLIGFLFKPLLSLVNAMIDTRLRETGLMIVEGKSHAERKRPLDQLIRVLLSEEDSRDELIRKAENFEKKYPALLRAGWLLILIVPLLLTILLFVFENKLVMLTLWIISLIAVVVYIIVIEFLNYNVMQRKEILLQTDDQILSALTKEKKGESHE